MLAIVLVVIAVPIGGCFVAIALIGSEVNEAVDTFSDLTTDFSNGVVTDESGSCTVTGVDFADDYSVDVMITNTSGSRSSYRLDYELFGPDGASLGTDFGVVIGVPDGEQDSQDAVGIVDAAGGPDPSEVRCEVGTILRIPALGS